MRRTDKTELKIEAKVVRFIHRMLDWAFVLLLLILYAFGIYAVWDSYTVIENASPNKYEEYKAEGDYLSFEELQEINGDVFGWLSIYGTNIDYPLVQGKDNEEYLSKEADGSYSSSGSLFLDYRNNTSFKDFNSIIHGHYMQYGVMFGDIGNFEEKEFFDSHLYGNLYFDGEDHGVELFAYLKADTYDSLYYTPGISQVRSQQLLLKRIKAEAVQYRDIEVSTADNIILCSTCTSDLSDERQILVGRITDEVFENPFADEDNDKSLLENARIVADVTPWWMYVLSLIFVLLCIRLLLRRKARENQAAETDNR